MYNNKVEENKRYDNLCFAITAYVLFGVGAALYNNSHTDYGSKVLPNEKNNIAAILVEEPKISSKKSYNGLSRFRTI